jgi:hypothetical protein
MLKTKRYTIMFGYAGVSQYAEFYERGGKLINPDFRVNWAKIKDIPSVAECETIDEALAVIKGFSINAEIHLINGTLVSIHNNKKATNHLKAFKNRIEKILYEEAIKYWESILEPFMIKNKWFIGTSHLGAPVLIHKDENGEWDNISYSREQLNFEVLCGRFAKDYNSNVEFNLKGEGRPWAKGFQPFISMLDLDYLKERSFFIDL